jgi:hypothetical protein
VARERTALKATRVPRFMRARAVVKGMLRRTELTGIL